MGLRDNDKITLNRCHSHDFQICGWCCHYIDTKEEVKDDGTNLSLDAHLQRC